MFILFFLMWVIFNGSLTLEIALFGVAVAGLMYGFLCKFMDFSFHKDLQMWRCFGLILLYLAVLFVEIIKANVKVTLLILTSRRKVEPMLIHFRTDLRSKTARTVLANSITLTPGTITVSLEENEFVVHCLDKDMSEGMEESVFVKLLRKMEEVAL